MAEPVRDQVRQFVTRHTDGVPVEDDEDLFDGGHVNSLFVVQLVTWIEREFELTLPLNDLVLDDLRTIASIASVVAAKSAREQTWTSA
jgi:acyl carrier protein